MTIARCYIEVVILMWLRCVLSEIDESMMSLIISQHTVGTFSWLQGNPYPSFVMVSIPTAARPVTLIPSESGRSGDMRALRDVEAVNSIAVDDDAVASDRIDRRSAATRAYSAYQGGVEFRACFLPSQLHIYILYAILGV